MSTLDKMLIARTLASYKKAWLNTFAYFSTSSFHDTASKNIPARDPKQCGGWEDNV
jgi:hypothetical protein